MYQKETWGEKKARWDYWKNKSKKKKNNNQKTLDDFKVITVILHDVISLESFVIDRRERREFIKNYKNPHRLIVLPYVPKKD